MKAKRQPPSLLNNCVDYGIFILLCLVFSPAVLYLGISSIYHENDLRDHGVIVNASMTDSQVDQSGSAPKYEVKYQFRAGFGNTVYSCADSTGRHDLWCGVTEEQWRRSQSTQSVEVVYLAENPWVNRPVHGTISMNDSIAGIFLGIGPWILFLFLWLSRRNK